MKPKAICIGILWCAIIVFESKWMIAKNMGDKINTLGSEYCPMISPDGKYLFFTGSGRNGRGIPDKPFTYEDFMNDHNRVKNGLSDIFWVGARIIEDLKPKS